MSKNKFTSGPWWSPDGKTIKQDYRPLTEAGGCIIAGVMGGSTSGPYFIEIDEEVSANTRLIAAAPELLEALEHARLFIRNGVEIGYIRMPDADTPDPAHETLPRVEAALAKARGE